MDIEITSKELDEAMNSLVWIDKNIESKETATSKQQKIFNEFKKSMKTALKACMVVKALAEGALEEKNIEVEEISEGEEKCNENAKKILKELKDRNLEEIPSNKYWWEYETVKKFNLDKDEKVSLKKTKGKLFYKQVNSWLYILKEREERKAPERSKKTEEEKMHARNRKKLNAIQDALTKDIKDFIGEMVQGKIDIVATPNEIWDALILLDVDVCYSKLQVYIYNLIYEKNINYNIEIEDDKKEELNNKISEISMERQMLALITKIPIVNNWSNEINKESASKVLKLVKVLSKSGFSLTEEQQQFLDGTLADQWKDSGHVHV